MAIFGFPSSLGGNRHDGRRTNRRACGQRPARRGLRSRFRPSVDALEERALLSTVTVTNTHDSGPGSLRDAINNAVSGEVINFAKSAYGTITLTSGPLVVNMIDLTIQGPGEAKLTISGGGTNSDFVLYSVFPPTYPPPPDFMPSSVNISGLTIANGDADSNGYGGGGGILSFDSLTVTNSVFQNDQAPNGIGGAIYSGCCGNLGLDVANDVFTGNTSGSATTDNDFSMGGAIFNTGGTAVIQSSTFVNNQAIGPNALGGAIHTSFGSTLTVSGSTFRNNQALGSFMGEGGAIFGDPAFVSVDSSQLINNVAEGTTPYGTNSGGAIVTTAQDYTSIGTIGPAQVTEPITNCVFTGNLALGAAGSGANVEGGAILNYDGILDVAGCTFIGNQAVGGSSTTYSGGSANGGAIVGFTCVVDLTSDSFLGNQVVGGSSPLGAGFTFGGAVNSFFGNPQAPNPTSTISNSLFAGNSAVGGSGGGPYSAVNGGALAYIGSPVAISNTTFVANQAVGGPGAAGVAGTEADGGAIWAGYGASMSIQGGVIAGNCAVGGGGGADSGGTGGNGANGGGGGIAVVGGESLTINGITITANAATGGAGGKGGTAGTGGNGLGGGIEIDDTSTLTITSGIVIGNLAVGGAGGGAGDGGGVYTLGTTTFIDTLVTLNLAAGGNGGGLGTGGGLYIGGGTTTLVGKTKVIANFANIDNNIFGPYST